VTLRFSEIIDENFIVWKYFVSLFEEFNNPEHPSTRAFLASTYALMGEAERADTELAEARRLSTDNRYSSTTLLF
jgi:hypothetical protein